MADSIDIIDRDYQFRLQWYCDGEEGAILGETMYRDDDLTKAERDDLAFVSATLAAGKTEGVKHDSSGYFWETMTHAKRALVAARFGAKNYDAPWPEWAIRAKAEGWKPPKKWKP